MDKTADWFFDFISPFAWLQIHSMDRLDCTIAYRPVLFAGLLSHWGQLGPAEIPQKRIFTYQHTLWTARKLGIPLRYPKGHPFNPLPFLRLAIAAGCRADAVLSIFHYIWVEADDLEDPQAFSALAAQLGISNPETCLADPEVKATLRANGTLATGKGVFGVPTFLVDDHLFWGFDATDMVLDFLHNPSLFEDDEMKRVTELPMLASRK